MFDLHVCLFADGASAVLDSWESTGSKSGRNKRNKNKSKQPQPPAQQQQQLPQLFSDPAALKPAHQSVKIVNNTNKVPMTNGHTEPVSARQQNG